MKKVVAVILLILGWWCTWAALFGFAVVVVPPPALQQSGDATRLFIYCCLSLLCGVFVGWGGIVLKKRWRIPLGLVCIFMGLGLLQEGYQLATAGFSTPPKLMEVMNPVISLLGITSIVAGIVVAASQKYIDRKLTAAGFHQSNP